MRKFRLALAQIDVAVGDLEGNAKKIIEYIGRAREVGADLVAFPEMAIPGYPPEDLLFKPQFIRENLARLEQITAASKGIAVVTGFIDSDRDVYNAAAFIYDGQLIGKYHKMYLPNYGVFDEDRYFKTGTKCPVYTINGTPVGVNICEDIWYATGPTVVQRAAGAELIVNINGSPFHAGKRSFREKMLATRAADNGLFVAYVNLVGGQDELVFDGDSMIYDPEGEAVAHASQFREELLVADLDVESVFRSRLRDPRPRKERDRMLDEIGTPVLVDVSGYSANGEKPDIPEQDIAAFDEVGEVYEALVLGTRDYVRKCGFSKVLIALSGGIDSTIVAAIAVDALGSENVVVIAMPSRYSSEGSVSDAKTLADNLGIEMWTVPIEEPFTAFLNTLSPHFEGTEWGVAEENIQSRIRGNLIMAMSNKFGWLVLTTGNKSEMATGYATIYGDMAGGYAVIKDVPKILVYELCRYRNRVAGKDLIPQTVIDKPPSAELRPDQVDEDSLPPYSVLDPILKAYVEDDLSYDEIIGLGYSEEDVKRAITLVDRNEYKRRQAPPGIKITPRNFGRDRRMPIANRYRPF
ncbi:MAG: NAD+ synthase [Chloroflexi bacterium]|nr:NAD+ synthase [Chloroflexota bacterium]MCI0790908.1 NAD+ synthase [Chloroflexota bacterium]